ncbi:Fur-regulated basic protein FbpA [Pullulanibacillus sp. KACC 23026]|nr:Fur-regulated basic protein FbpA [Pullulanibacillus sp. KACC 23026]WEG15063.1 Fur-regulated basic protein FbpA [Pullulanibacillus sp. KACC 23026]
MNVDSLFRESIEKRRQQLIKQLIESNIYKVNHRHLFELTLKELEAEYSRTLNRAFSG